MTAQERCTDGEMCRRRKSEQQQGKVVYTLQGQTNTWVSARQHRLSDKDMILYYESGLVTPHDETGLYQNQHLRKVGFGFGAYVGSAHSQFCSADRHHHPSFDSSTQDRFGIRQYTCLAMPLCSEFRVPSPMRYHNRLVKPRLYLVACHTLLL